MIRDRRTVVVTREGVEPRVVSAGFNARVYRVVQAIPAGQVATYGDVARVLGSARVARHVGFALAALRDPSVPWHRVINARGELSGPDRRRQEVQRQRLVAEGVGFDGRGRVQLGRFRHHWPEWSRVARPSRRSY